MKKSVFVFGCLVVMLFVCCEISLGFEGVSPKKAFEMLKNPSTYLIDVRSIAEYYFVGHPEMAYNIPLAFWDEKQQGFTANEKFVDDVLSRFKKDDVLIFICRSGGRSQTAARMVERSGFSRVYNVVEGFEGEKDEQGFRTIGGWKNSGLPYTYELKKDLLYKSVKQEAHTSVSSEFSRRGFLSDCFLTRV